MSRKSQRRAKPHPIVDLKNRVRDLEEITARHEKELDAADGALRQMRRTLTEGTAAGATPTSFGIIEFSDGSRIEIPSLTQSTAGDSFSGTESPEAPEKPAAESLRPSLRARAAHWALGVLTHALAVAIGLVAAVEFIGK